jgi:hypothetical protein
MSAVALPGIPNEVQAGVINVEGLGQIPVVEMNWLDERTGCARAHRYLAGELQGVLAHAGASSPLLDDVLPAEVR